MRHFARRLFTLCSAVSLVLLLAMLVLWPLSYWRGRLVERRENVNISGERWRRSYCGVTMNAGRVSVEVVGRNLAAAHSLVLWQRHDWTPQASWRYREWRNRTEDPGIMAVEEGYDA